MSTIHFEMHQKKMDREMNKYEIGQIQQNVNDRIYAVGIHPKILPAFLYV